MNVVVIIMLLQQKNFVVCWFVFWLCVSKEACTLCLRFSNHPIIETWTVSINGWWETMRNNNNNTPSFCCDDRRRHRRRHRQSRRSSHRPNRRRRHHDLRRDLCGFLEPIQRTIPAKKIKLKFVFQKNTKNEKRTSTLTRVLADVSMNGMLNDLARSWPSPVVTCRSFSKSDLLATNTIGALSASFTCCMRKQTRKLN